MRLLIGTCGWQYAHWRGVLYPRGLPTARWLETYAGEFPCVEVDSTFYSLPSRPTVERWASVLPPAYVVAAKASRYLTHIRRLRDPEEPVALLLDRLAPLGTRLGPVLVQLPPSLRADLGRLRATLDAFPRGVRVAVEPRHSSWFTGALRALLEERGAALALTDRLGRPLEPLWATATWGYVRLHEGRASPRPRYGRAALAAWLGRTAELWPGRSEVLVLFNNDPGGQAVRNAREIAGLARRRGLEVVRPPAVPARTDGDPPPPDQVL